MPTVYSLFGPKPQFESSSGQPLVAGKLYFYVSGSTTPKATYTDSTGTVTNTNPVVLNSLGSPANGIWGTTGAYRIVCEDLLANVLWTVDGIVGINDIAAATTVEWIASNLTPTYISATSFSVPGDQTALFTPGRRIQTTNTGGVITSVVVTSAFGAVTTVTVANDSGVIDSGLTAVTYALLNSVAPSVPFTGMPRGTVASAGTVNLQAVPAPYIQVTGTTGITAVTLNNGVEKRVQFAGALLLTNSANLILPGNGNIQTQGGDTAVLVGEPGNVTRCVDYQRSTGNALALFGKTRTITGATTLTVDDAGTMVFAGGGGTYTVTLPDSTTLPEGWHVRIVNNGAILTVSRAGADTIQGPGLPVSAPTSITLPYTGSGELSYNNGAATFSKFSTTWRVDFDSTAHGSQLFTASGTWTCPLGVNTVFLDGAGAGGGGGGSNGTGAGGGGGGGQAVLGLRTAVVPGTAYTVTVSATGGTAGTAGGGNGAKGGDTIFGALLTLTGGNGGTGGAGAGGAGGAAGGAGGVAGTAGSVLGGVGYFGGAGGGTIWGPTAVAALSVATGPNGNVYGVGGVGGTAGGAGGTGALGFLRVTW